MIRKFLARVLIAAAFSIGAFPCVASAQSVPYASNPCAPTNTLLLVNTPINYNASGTQQLVPAPPFSTQRVYVCKVVILGAGATNVTLETGTGTLCATGLTALTGPMPLAASTGWVEGPGAFPPYTSALGGGICLANSAAIQVSGSILTITQ